MLFRVQTVCPPEWVTLGTSPSPALARSSTMNGCAKKSEVIPNSGKRITPGSKPFLHLPHFESQAGVFQLKGLEVNF